MTQDTENTNIIALVKGTERYVFLYSDERLREILFVLGSYASNPELSFTWYDAVVLGQEIQEQAKRRFSF